MLNPFHTTTQHLIDELRLMQDFAVDIEEWESLQDQIEELKKVDNEIGIQSL